MKMMSVLIIPKIIIGCCRTDVTPLHRSELQQHVEVVPMIGALTSKHLLSPFMHSPAAMTLLVMMPPGALIF